MTHISLLHFFEIWRVNLNIEDVITAGRLIRTRGKGGKEVWQNTFIDCLWEGREGRERLCCAFGKEYLWLRKNLEASEETELNVDPSFNPRKKYVLEGTVSYIITKLDHNLQWMPVTFYARI